MYGLLCFLQVSTKENKEYREKDKKLHKILNNLGLSSS